MGAQRECLEEAVVQAGFCVSGLPAVSNVGTLEHILVGCLEALGVSWAIY